MTDNPNKADLLPARMRKAGEGTPLEEFRSIVHRLRVECPWDREQTHASLRPMLIEESYETVEAIDLAIDTGDYTELKKELGDLLLHILFHSDLAAEEGHFTLEDVIQAECEKLIYRHPHVFSDVKVEDAEHVSRNWEQLKRREKGRNSILDGVPASLPALQRAARVQERAAKAGFDWPSSGIPNRAPEGVWKKIREEILELEEELISPSHSNPDSPSYSNPESPSHSNPDSPSHSNPDSPSFSRRGQGVVSPKIDEFGDLLFSLVNFARHEGMDAEGALRAATDKFSRRFQAIEREVESAAADGRPFSDFSLQELDAIWDRVKKKM